MTLLTTNKKTKLKIISDIRYDYRELIARPGAMRMAVYEELAKRHGVSTRTVMSYVKAL